MRNFPKGKNWKNKTMIYYKHWSHWSAYFQKTFVEMKRVGEGRTETGKELWKKITQLT